ncbi:MAG: GtrA family protein [Candidatus Paceibacterota bacterium]
MKLLKQVFKFVLVGGLNTGIDIGILTFLMKISGITGGYSYAVFKAFSSLIAITNSYFLNKRWTFRDKSQENLEQASQFFFVSGIGLLINVAAASLVNNFVLPIEPLIAFINFFLNLVGITLNSNEIWGVLSAAAGSISGLGWNFLGYKFFIFKK